MIWRGLRNYFLAEFFAWIAFLLLGLTLGLLGARSNSPSVSQILIIVWFALFVWIYRIIHNRTKQQG